MKKYIPSFITLLNLSAGFIAILLNDPFWSPILILTGALFDLLDGIFAKALNAISEIGKQLDSLADLVTFCIAPAYLYYQYLLPGDILGIIAVSLIPVFGALRLARFNVKENVSNTFNGLPTPANGIFFSSLPFLKNQYQVEWLNYILNNQLIILLLPIIFGLFMIINIKMFSFKETLLRIPQLTFVICSVILLILFQLIAVPIIILIYIIISIIFSNRIGK